MANRTFKILGKAYGETNSSVTVKVNGTTVYTGTVDSLGLLPEDHSGVDLADSDVIATFELAMPAAGLPAEDAATTVEVIGGTVLVGPIHSDYAEGAVANGHLATDIIPLELGGKQAKHAPSIDGAAIDVPANSGELTHAVSDGSALSFTLTNKSEKTAVYVPA